MLASSLSSTHGTSQGTMKFYFEIIVYDNILYHACQLSIIAPIPSYQGIGPDLRKD